jgi:hypothetical protein
MNFVLTLALISTWSPPPGYDFWIGGMDQNWSNGGNWSTPFIPDGPGQMLLLGHKIDYVTPYTTVNMQSMPRTVGNLIFDPDLTMTIQGPKLTLDALGASSTIDASGTQTIVAPVVLKNDTIVSGSGTLTMSNGISGNYTLTVTGHLNAKSIQVDTLIIQAPGGSNVVPEPGGIALLGAGAAGFLAWRRIRRSDNRR